MLTFRRGVARVGWVLLATWLALWTVFFVVGRSQSPDPPPIDAMLAIQLAAVLFGYPLAIFVLWRLVLWIALGFWQSTEKPVDRRTAPADPESRKIVH
jgi:hypothetical protein